MNRRRPFLLVLVWLAAILFPRPMLAQLTVSSGPWVADPGNGSYRNPIIHADYSDPDVIRVGTTYYLIASSFQHAPGLPILQSYDLVNWSIATYALPRLVPQDHFSSVQNGNGVWAPSIRFHRGEYYIYYPDPDFGIYLIKAKNIRGPWSVPTLVVKGKGLIDPCPFWDDDGRAYLVHAFAGSRAGIKSLLVLRTMSPDGMSSSDPGRIIYDGHDEDPTVEGPKMYKRGGYYYVFAPAGGVTNGWQIALRSKDPYGPYERKIVMDQGQTTVNGPHQGAWVETPNGESWFLHFQDKGAYGRIVHLQPMTWKNDWPVIGADPDGDGKGEPVMVHIKPRIGKVYPPTALPASDEFNGNSPGLQWQWQANPQPFWAFAANGQLRLFSVRLPDSIPNYWRVPNLFTQKFPAEEFVATAKIRFKPRLNGERAGLVVLGSDYASLSLIQQPDGLRLAWSICSNADKGSPEQTTIVGPVNTADLFLQVQVSKGAICQFSFSRDGKNFSPAGNAFAARPGRWTGATIGLFCTRTVDSNDSGFMEVDWFRVTGAANSSSGFSTNK